MVHRKRPLFIMSFNGNIRVTIGYIIVIMACMSNIDACKSMGLL
jgi:hypothetical protein